jgi:predicted MFS family arabinose efflux permease
MPGQAAYQKPLRAAAASAPAAALADAVGGPARGTAIALLAAVLGLQAADLTAVGAVGTELERELRISHIELGLLAAVPSLLAAAATLPLGILADRVNRVRLLRAVVVSWGVAMLVAGLAWSYGALIVSRVFLGVAIAAAAPLLASLTGDLFPSRERARIYGYVITGELIGSAFGFVVSGNIAGLLGWRWAFWVLALPAGLLAWKLGRSLPEPARGGQSRLEPGDTEILGAEQAERRRRGDSDRSDPEAGEERVAEQIAERRGVKPDRRVVLEGDPAALSLREAVRYVLLTRTNVILIIVSATGYFFLGGVQTFGVVFVRRQYDLGQSAATSLLADLGIAALIGAIAGGRTADRLLDRGRLNARIVVPAATFAGAALLFALPLAAALPLVAAMPFFFAATGVLTAGNPPLDAARLDVMPFGLWGRAESIRTVLRSLAVAAAPLLFGVVASALGGHSTGLRLAFLVMVVPLAASGFILLRARRTYANDIATALESERNAAQDSQDGGREPEEAAVGHR